jgi:hypothetical protein
MAISIILALSVGVVLGYLFKVFILIPIIAVVVVAAIGAGLARAEDAWSIALTAIGITIVLAIGYLIGSGVRAHMVARKATQLAESEAAPLTSVNDGLDHRDADAGR